MGQREWVVITALLYTTGDDGLVVGVGSYPRVSLYTKLNGGQLGRSDAHLEVCCGRHEEVGADLHRLLAPHQHPHLQQAAGGHARQRPSFSGNGDSCAAGQLARHTFFVSLCCINRTSPVPRSFQSFTSFSQESDSHRNSFARLKARAAWPQHAPVCSEHRQQRRRTS